MNFSIVRRYIAIVIAIIGIAMLLPAVVSCCYRESAVAFAFLASSGIALAVSVVLFYRTKQKPAYITYRETILIVVGSWFGAASAGALPYLITGTFPGVIDAFFESVSGFTTTGASVMTDIVSNPYGILFWRSFTQWLGGMGLIALFVALFPVFGMGAARMLEAETPAGQEGEKLNPRLRIAVRRLLIIYVALTLLQTIFLIVSGLPLFDSINLSFTSIATGGFAPTALSIEDYHNGAAEIVIMVFMFLGGINFSLFYWLVFRNQFKRVLKNVELRLYVAIALIALVIVNYDLIVNMGMTFSEAIRVGFFNTLSISTTTGYSTTDFNTWPSLSKAVLLILMVIGGSAGSTAGGMKVIRILVLGKYLHRDILKFFNPQRIISLKIENSALSATAERRAIELILMYLTVLVGATLVMSAIGLDIVSAVSSVASCMASVGPGFGQVGPYGNYAAIPSAGKGVLMFAMMSGRVELFSVLALFLPSFWKRF
ncbi:MAG: TrkH family potassium uptake protein [Dehalococcoidaceae bacterium]|nr:TrkH family potassium uptake protein [Dehalococcoidaceae bacterium]